MTKAARAATIFNRATTNSIKDLRPSGRADVALQYHGTKRPARRYRRSVMTKAIVQKAPADLQENIARLTERGLVTRIDRRIDKDSELHPLARWQFQGGLRGGPPRASRPGIA